MTAVADQKERIVYFDLLRPLAAFAVMVLHIVSETWSSTDVNSFDWSVLNFYDSLCRWGVPVFVMISGSLFLSREISIGRLFKNNILRLAVVFLVWSFAYSLVFNIFANYSVNAFISALVTGHYHLWFLYMLIGLYLITPLLKKITEDDRLTKYFLLLALIFAVTVPEIIAVLKVYLPKVGTWLDNALSQAHIRFVLGYSVYYVLGYALGRAEISRRNALIISGLGLIGFASTVVFSLLVSRHTQKASLLFYNNLTLNVLFEAAAVFVFAKMAFPAHRLRPGTKAVLMRLSKYSLGAYLFHPLAIHILKTLFGLTSASFHPLISVPVLSLVTFVFSFAVSALLNHIPLIRKYCV